MVGAADLPGFAPNPRFPQDFEGAELVELSFSKNGQDLGAAFRIPKDSLGDRALLPHVLCKGCAVELNFGQRPEPPAPVPDGFVFIHAVPAPERVRTPPGPKSTEECEVSGGGSGIASGTGGSGPHPGGNCGVDPSGAGGNPGPDPAGIPVPRCSVSIGNPGAAPLGILVLVPLDPLGIPAWIHWESILCFFPPDPVGIPVLLHWELWCLILLDPLGIPV